MITMKTTTTDDFEFVASCARSEISYALGQHAASFVHNKSNVIALVLEHNGVALAGIISPTSISEGVRNLSRIFGCLSEQQIDLWIKTIQSAAEDATTGSPPDSVSAVITICDENHRMLAQGGHLDLDQAAFLAGLPASPAGQN